MFGLFLLLIPVVAVVLALAWSAWASRPPRKLSPEESVLAYQRALQALAPEHAPRRGRRRELVEPR